MSKKSFSVLSFYDIKGHKWSNGIINLNDKSGNTFVQTMTNDENAPAGCEQPLGEYIGNAGYNEIYDFKVTNGGNALDESYSGLLTSENYIYRGMEISTKHGDVIASARDIGNYVAGYYAGANGFSWEMSRVAFDIYQGGIENIQTQSAEYIGWKDGCSSLPWAKAENLIRSTPSLFNFVKDKITGKKTD